MGTPITRVSDWPLITQPSARPRWLSGTRPETSAKTTPMKAPAQPPPTVAQTATQKNEPASACASTARERAKRPPTSSGCRPTTSDNQPPSAEVMPQAVAVSDTRLATTGMLTSRSRAMSSRNGARVVPLEVAAKEPRQAPPIDRGIEQVDEEIDDDEEEGDHDQVGRHHRDVGELHGLDEELAHAGPLEHRLGDDREGDQAAHLQADHGDHRQQRVLQRVAEMYGAVRQTAGARELDVVGAQHLEHLRAHQPQHQGHLEQRE